MKSAHVTDPATSTQRRAAPAIAALRLEHVTLEYADGTHEDGSPRTVRALDTVDFSAETGTITALVGPSGSGKTTITNQLVKELRRRDVPLEVLDGDIVR